jgi:hypothetical protein
MEPLSPQQVSTRSKRPGTLHFARSTSVLAAYLMLTAGCASTNAFFHVAAAEPSGDICQVVAAWIPEVAFTPDPTHGGAPTPGIAGRVYLFGPEIDFPRAGDGSLVVDLYDNTAAGRKDVPLEEWRIDSETLKRLRRRDAVGWGYTVFLPWGTYKPEINRVQLRLRYEPAKGNPLYADSSTLVLNRDSKSITPAAVASAPTKPSS